jgi:sugar lactone lactonase YvrE
MGSPIAQERRRGYHRARPAPAEPVVFTLDGHAFETDGKHLWVTPPGSDRIDRIKVSRYLGDRSARQGYPRELIRPEPLTEDWARAAAAFWLEWAKTADAAAFPPVFLDHYVRQQERLQLLPS